jgi:hypothetical protein
MFLKARKYILNWKKVKMEMISTLRAKSTFIAINVIGNSKIFSTSFVESAAIRKIYDLL